MHKGIILITPADNADDAKSKAESFLEGYGDGHVWDWYVIGGRWSGELNQTTNKFKTEANKLFKNPDFVSTQDVEDNADKLQALWVKLGGKGKNPYNRSSYDQEGNDDDIVELKDCYNIVREWQQDPQAEGEKCLQQAEQERAKDAFHHGYYYKKAGEMFSQEFCFDCNVFNIDAHNYSVPINPNGYWAVMIDIHN